jgi:hypothetical protein
MATYSRGDREKAAFVEPMLLLKQDALPDNAGAVASTS